MTENKLREEVIKELVNHDSHYDCDWYNFDQVVEFIDLAIQKAREDLLDEIEEEIKGVENDNKLLGGNVPVVMRTGVILNIINKLRSTKAKEGKA